MQCFSRWLRSRDGRFDETADALKKNMILRKAWDLDNLSDWKAPEVFAVSPFVK